MTKTHTSYLAVAAACLLVAGCADGASRPLLTGPSALSDGDGSTVAFTSMSGGNETPRGPTPPLGPGGGKKARGEGVVGAITGACPELTLIITGTRVSTTPDTEYVNGTCETLRPGTQVTIDGELFPGGVATADRIEIRRVPGRERVSGDGRVDSVTGTCPELTLIVRGITVLTTADTTFVGGACEDIRERSHLDVTGEYDGTQVTASAVAIRRR